MLKTKKSILEMDAGNGGFILREKFMNKGFSSSYIRGPVILSTYVQRDRQEC